MSIPACFTSLWKSHPLVRPLLLITHYFSHESALYNEGVWHNSLMGLNLIHYLRRRHAGSQIAVEKDSSIESKEFTSEAILKLDLLAQSLHALNFSKEHGLFRQRTLSPFWDHSKLEHIAFSAQYYATPNPHMKLISNALAYVFYRELSSGTMQQIRRENHARDAARILDLDTFFEHLHESFYDSRVGLYHTVVDNLQESPSEGHRPRSRKFKAIDHALLLLATMVHHEHQTLEVEKKCSLERINTLRNILLHRFKYNTADSYIDYIQWNESTAELVEKQQHFLWQDIWTLLVLALAEIRHFGSTREDTPPISHLIEHLFTVYYNPDKGYLMNEPTAYTKASWGGPLCAFGNDNALMYCLGKITSRHFPSQRMQKFVTHFEREALPKMLHKKSDGSVVVRDLFSHSEQPDETLWITSEFLFSIIHDSADEFFL